MKNLKVLLLLPLIGIVTACSHVNIETHSCKITGKESINSRSGHEYRVYTDCGTYIMEDQATRLNFNSADNYGRLEVGKTYEIVGSGYRIPFLSMFKAINSVKEVK